jgi:hypothetical protein
MEQAKEQAYVDELNRQFTEYLNKHDALYQRIDLLITESNADAKFVSRKSLYGMFCLFIKGYSDISYKVVFMLQNRKVVAISQMMKEHNLDERRMCDMLSRYHCDRDWDNVYYIDDMEDFNRTLKSYRLRTAFEGLSLRYTTIESVFSEMVIDSKIPKTDIEKYFQSLLALID